MTDATPSVTIVIVTYQSRDDIERCLRSVRTHTTIGHRIVVVDNASADGTADLVEQQFPDVELIRSDTNLGFAAGVNLGASGAGTPYVLLLNPDTELRAPAVDVLVDTARSSPQHRIYGGRTVDADGEVDYLSAWGVPTLWSLLCFATGLSTWRKRSALFDPESLGDWARDTQRTVPAVSGCLQLIDTTLWRDLGGLDEAYWLYGEDLDWAIRAGRAGAEPLLVPEAEIMHEVGASSSSENQRVMVLRGKATVFRRLWPRPKAVLGVSLLLAGTALRGPVANGIRRLLGREPDRTWAAAWERRMEWRSGW
jgi:GT2 family glycosyltransferase